MPKKIPLVSVTVFRDNKPVALPVGKPFAFTDAEVQEVEAAIPGALRDPINEVAPPAEPEPVTKGGTKGGKKGDDSL